MKKTSTNQNGVQDSRERIIGKTWLTLQLMQGSTLTCHHQPKRHFAKIGKIIVTEEHESEAGLVGELIDFPITTTLPAYTLPVSRLETTLAQSTSTPMPLHTSRR